MTSFPSLDLDSENRLWLKRELEPREEEAAPVEEVEDGTGRINS